MQRCLRVAWGIVFIFAFSVQAETKIYGEQRVSGWWNWLKNDVSQTWNEPQNYDLYLPFLSWHNRFMYDKEKTDNYNEMPWGGGFGVSRNNQQATWSSLYTIKINESHNARQPKSRISPCPTRHPRHHPPPRHRQLRAAADNIAAFLRQLSSSERAVHLYSRHL